MELMTRWGFLERSRERLVDFEMPRGFLELGPEWPFPHIVGLYRMYTHLGFDCDSWWGVTAPRLLFLNSMTSLKGSSFKELP